MVAMGLLPEVVTSRNLSMAFRQQITLTKSGARFFARRSRRAGAPPGLTPPAFADLHRSCVRSAR